MNWQEQLQEELTYEEFLMELERFKSWVSKSNRRRGSWLLSMEQWAQGNR
jgi:hypothetical protein